LYGLFQLTYSAMACSGHQLGQVPREPLRQHHVVLQDHMVGGLIAHY
jgi:hypothetical protein